MPATLNFPGVYIEEVPSGVRTITGVATSITAFVGRALRGTLNEPTLITSFGDFERAFGGLWQDSTLGYAVRAYFQNGGSQAVIVRLFHGAPSIASVTTGGTGDDKLVLVAASPGKWGEGLRAVVDHNVTKAAATSLGLAETDLFNLTVTDTAGRTSEVFRNVTVRTGHPRNLTQVLKNESRLVKVASLPAPANTRPAPVADNITTGEARLAADTAAVATASANLDKAIAALAAATAAAAKATGPEKAAADAAKAAAETAKTAAETAKTAAGTTLTNSSNALTAARTAQQATDGAALDQTDFIKSEASKEGLFALLKTDLFNLLNIPPHSFTGASPDVEPALLTAAAKLCEDRRAMLIVDPPAAWTTVDSARLGTPPIDTISRNAALFFPRLTAPDVLQDGQLVDFAPGGAVAGVFARTDATRGVWKAPAGIEANLVGVPALSVPLTDAEIGLLNPLGINCLRNAPAAGRVVWGARTRQGDDRLASEWKYIPVRRLALFIEESLFRGTQWVVFEPNDEPLWAQIRLNLGAFMQDLFRQGAFQGKTPREAYFVKVDRETTTQSDINNGIVNIHVGFAPLKPAEFVVIKIQQIAGSLAGA